MDADGAREIVARHLPGISERVALPLQDQRRGNEVGHLPDALGGRLARRVKGEAQADQPPDPGLVGDDGLVAIAPIWVTNMPGQTAVLAGQMNIIDVDVPDADYSPLWSVILVAPPSGSDTAANDVRSLEGLATSP